MGNKISEDLAASILKLVQENWVAGEKANIILRKGMADCCKGKWQQWSTYPVDGAVGERLEW